MKRLSCARVQATVGPAVSETAGEEWAAGWAAIPHFFAPGYFRKRSSEFKPMRFENIISP